MTYQCGICGKIKHTLKGEPVHCGARMVKIKKTKDGIKLRK